MISSRMKLQFVAMVSVSTLSTVLAVELLSPTTAAVALIGIVISTGIGLGVALAPRSDLDPDNW